MSLEGLDEGQYAAAAHNDGRHGLASAGPGSGKTKTVIAHVGELLRRGGTLRRSRFWHSARMPLKSSRSGSSHQERRGRIR